MQPPRWYALTTKVRCEAITPARHLRLKGLEEFDPVYRVPPPLVGSLQGNRTADLPRLRLLQLHLRAADGRPDHCPAFTRSSASVKQPAPHRRRRDRLPSAPLSSPARARLAMAVSARRTARPHRGRLPARRNPARSSAPTICWRVVVNIEILQRAVRRRDQSRPTSGPSKSHSTENPHARADTTQIA